MMTGAGRSFDREISRRQGEAARLVDGENRIIEAMATMRERRPPRPRFCRGAEGEASPSMTAIAEGFAWGQLNRHGSRLAARSRAGKALGKADDTRSPSQHFDFPDPSINMPPFETPCDGGLGTVNRGNRGTSP